MSLIPDINDALGLSLPLTITEDELRNKLAAHINHLIDHDFEKLVYYLYRIDVDETKMRSILEQRAGEDSAGLIAAMIIERQLQKIETRKKTIDKKDIPDEDRW